MSGYLLRKVIGRMLKKKYSAVMAILLIIVVIVDPENLFKTPVFAQTTDVIPDLISQVSETNLINVSTTLVTQYGPRRNDTYSPFIDDQCTVSTTIIYPKPTIEMSSDYVKGLFEGMGYPAGSITMEEVTYGNELIGHNVYVTKVGSTYPNVYIEIAAHMDTVETSPGGSDNSTGSSAVIEIARVLKDYSNRYSMRFIVWVGEEYDPDRDTSYLGSEVHVQNVLARREQIKAGLNLDHIGVADPDDPTGYMNQMSYNSAESERIANIFDAVLTEYGIAMGFEKWGAIQNSDQWSYWDAGLTAVSSAGASLTTPHLDPYYHTCADTVDNISFGNTLRITQQNLAAGIKLDQEPLYPTVANISSLTGTYYLTAVQLDWDTFNELDLVGFNVYRDAYSAEKQDWVKQRLNISLIPAQNPGQLIGASYSFTDEVTPGSHYTYWVEMIHPDGSEWSGPVMVTAGYLIHLPLLKR